MTARDDIAKVLADQARELDVQEVARKAVEDALIEMRDAGISQPLRNNGCVVKYRDGLPSDIIRFGPETAVVIGVEAIASHLADALLASPAHARLLDEARAEGWDRRDKPHSHGDQRVNIVPPERRNPDDLDHEYGCPGWGDCHCFGYLNPYRKDTP